jgi:F0F1-type ATP synthase assembly protein I
VTKTRDKGNGAKIAALRFSAVGIEFGLGALLGYLLGAWLDRRFGTYPVLTLLMLLLGLAAAFSSLIKRVLEIERRDAREREDSEANQEDKR